MIKFEKISTDTCICISLLNKINLDKIIANFKQFKNVILLDFDKLSTEDRSKLPTHWILKHATKNKTCVNQNNLVSTNIENFFAHRDKNYCLNNKISILENGDVYPCLGAYNKVDKIGNIFNNEWNIIIKNLLQKYWLNNVNNKIKCKNCEFRYVCNSCSFLNSKENCSYDIEVGK